MHYIEVGSLVVVVLVILSLHKYYQCFGFELRIMTSLLCVSGVCLCRGVFACVESCSLQVMGSTRINSLHMVSKAMTGPLMNLHSIIMKEVTAIHFINLVF